MGKWEKLSTDTIGINDVCADIDVVTVTNGVASIADFIMRFSNVRDGYPNDIRIRFKLRSVLSFRYLDETEGHRLKLEGDKPKINSGHFPQAPYPILQTAESAWLKEMAMTRDTSFNHFLFLSLNCIVEVLASELPSFEIIR